jgi:hypothetical protein
MPLPKNLFAFTAPGADFPEYISVNRYDGSTDIRLDVRSPRPPNGSGENAYIVLAPEQARTLGLALIQATN